MAGLCKVSQATRKGRFCLPVEVWSFTVGPTLSEPPVTVFKSVKSNRWRRCQVQIFALNSCRREKAVSDWTQSFLSVSHFRTARLSIPVLGIAVACACLPAGAFSGPGHPPEAALPANPLTVAPQRQPPSWRPPLHPLLRPLLSLCQWRRPQRRTLRPLLPRWLSHPRARFTWSWLMAASGACSA